MPFGPTTISKQASPNLTNTRCIDGPMPNIQIKGPMSITDGPVSYQQLHQLSPGRKTKQFHVTIKLGDKLRPAADSSPQAEPVIERAACQTPSPSPRAVPRQITKSVPEPATKSEPRFESPGAPSIANTPDVRKAAPQIPASSDSESELEILEVRTINQRPDTWGVYGDREPNTSIDTESDLSSLDDELNNALSSTITMPTQNDPKLHQPAPRLLLPIHKLLPNLYRPVRAERSPPPPGYRNIPPNLVNAIQRELNLFFDKDADDEVEVVGKMTFSLKDPIARTKVRLPVRATTCRHFECFDFDNFCLFYKLPPGVMSSLRTSLILQSKKAREIENLFIQQQQKIAQGLLLFKSPELVYPQFSETGQMFFTDVYNRTPPLHKCPLCDEKFGLKQLYISDIFNFFVKTTPLHTTRIELVENDRYKIVEEDTVEDTPDNAEVVDLSGSEDEDGAAESKSSPSPKAVKSETISSDAKRSMTSEDFNDGLDEVLLKIGGGDGSWGDPVFIE